MGVARAAGLNERVTKDACERPQPPLCSRRHLLGMHTPQEVRERDLREKIQSQGYLELLTGKRARRVCTTG